MNEREKLLKQLKFTCLGHIIADHNYNLFTLAFQLKPNIIKKLIILLIQICDDMVKHKNYNKNMLTEVA